MKNVSVIGAGTMGNGIAHVFAQSGFPTSAGKPYSAVTVNSACTVSMTAAQKLKTAIHELGHCVGFMHTDDASGSLGIVATTANGTNCHLMCDPYSVMNQGLMSFSSFTDCDKAAFAKLYPR